MKIPEGAGDDLEEYGGMEGIKEMAPSRSVLDRLEGVYNLLSARGRIEILYFLNFTDMTPGMLCYLTDMAPNLISFHLRKLESARVVESRKEGRFIIYSITEMGRNLSGPMK